jgi:hypothetical protein
LRRVVAVAIAGLLAMGCKADDPRPAEPSGSGKSPMPAPTIERAAEPAVPKVGIDACDAYRARAHSYEVCAAIPAAERSATARAVETAVDTWRAMAEGDRAKVEQTCIDAAALLEQALTAAGCS